MMRKQPAKKRRRYLWIAALLCAVVLLFIELRLKPVTASVAAVHAQALTTSLIHQSVNEVLTETGFTPTDLEEIIYAADNSVTAIAANTVNTNRLKNDITLRIQESLSGISNHRVDVSLGTIIGGELLSGLEPSIPIWLSLSGNVSSDFDSSFEQGGVNQTVHRLSLAITADVTIVMPLKSVTTTVQTSVLIGETVIVGHVPSGMLLSRG